MLSATAPSAFARFLRSPLRRAAWTGAEGMASEGLVIRSYSWLAAFTEVLVERTSLVTVCWGSTKRASSLGTALGVEDEKIDPPIRLPEDLVLSSSVGC